MNKTLKVLNELEKKGIIDRYALGGATALLFYAEPALTYDIDVFIFLPKGSGRGKSLINLGPLYQVLKKKGYEASMEHVMIEGIPVQFIPAYNALVEEGVCEALEKDYQGIGTRVVQLEHLLAIMLETGRAKDKERVRKLLDEVDVDRKKLLSILTRHQLDKKWEKTIGKIKPAG